ncbi:response regulator [Allopusillimonas ginsengisoli]|uniref:response regulator n=1 Tax=Allopusillimonas ginsengisoli TaxID=453575 RepID=UPI0039C250D1
MVVEDNVELRCMISDILSQTGFHVLQAGTADDAAQKLQNGASVHVVFSDVNMPGEMDGIDLAKWLRRNRPEIKIVLTSGQLQFGAAGLCDGGSIIMKPFRLRTVVMRLLNVCHISQPLTLVENSRAL